MDHVPIELPAVRIWNDHAKNMPEGNEAVGKKPYAPQSSVRHVPLDDIISSLVTSAILGFYDSARIK